MTKPDGKKFEDEKVREEGARIIGLVREWWTWEWREEKQECEQEGYRETGIGKDDRIGAIYHSDC